MARVSSSKAFVHKLLKVLALSGMVLIAASSPYFGLNLARGIRKDLKRKKWREFYNDLHKLKKQGRINITGNIDGYYRVELTKLGGKIVLRNDLDNLTIEKPKKWDGRWRFFSFDIPVQKKMARHALLGKLKDLGFILVQRSLWAHPFECRKELMIIARAFEVEPYVLYLSAEEVSGREWLNKKFSRQNALTLI